MSILDQSAYEVASDAGYADNIDVYSVARMVASEGYRGISTTEKICLAETCRNEAIRRGITPTALLTETGHRPGYYGSNDSDHKWAATSKEPTDEDFDAADSALNQGSNLAQNATDFFDPHDQDWCHTHKGYSMDAAAYIAKQIKAGFQWIGEIAGVDSNRVYLMAKGAWGGAYARENSGGTAPISDGDDDSDDVSLWDSAWAIVLVGAAVLMAMRYKNG